MAESSVGTISLDLVIQDNVSQQLEKIKNNAMRPAQKTGETIQESIQKPIEKTAENMQNKLNSAFDNVSKNAEKSVKSFDNGIDNAIKKYSERMKNAEKQQLVADTKPEVRKVNTKHMSYDSKAMEEVNEYLETAGGKVDAQLKIIFNKLKDFKIPTSPIERLETELETTRTKSELLKNEWEKLSTSGPSEKVTAKMVRLQQQIIATDKSAERLENELQRANNLENGVITGEYQAPEKPIERLQRQFELTNQKIESVSRTWQQLQIELQNTNDSQSAEKIRDKLIQTENQLISLTNTADKFKQKITESSSETTKTIDSQFQKIFDKLKGFKIPTTPAKRLESEIQNTQVKVSLLQKKWQELSMAEPSEHITEQMLRIQQQIVSAQASTERLKSRLSELNKVDMSSTDKQIAKVFNRFTTFKIPSSPIEHFRRQLETTQSKTETLQKKLQVLSAAEPSKKISQQILTVRKQLEQAHMESEILQKKIANFNASHLKQEMNELISLLTSSLRGIGNTVLAPIQAVASGIFKIGKACDTVYGKIKFYLENPLLALRDVGKTTFSVIKKVGKSAFNGLKAVGNQALDSLRKRFGFFNKSALSLTKPIKKLGRTLKNTFRRVFVMATLYAAVKALKKSISSVMKQNEELSKSLNEVKANLAIAFTPILQSVMPALNTMMSGLARTTKYIAGFISGLFGMTYKQAAEATKKLYSTGKQAEDTAKKAKLSLAGFDEMNILSSGDDESEKEEDTGINYDNLDMSEPDFPDWAESLKNAIKNGDWYGVGEVLAERVNAVFSGIDWGNIEQNISNKINNICNLFNGFIDNVDFKTIGDSFAGGINAISNAVNTFSDNIHWDKLGNGLAKGLNQTIKKVKWQQLGRSLSANIRIITDVLYDFVTEFDWEGLGNGIGEAINGWFDGIDFGKLAKTLSGGITGIFSTITTTLQTINFSSIGQKIAEFVNNINIPEILSQFASSVSSLITGLLNFLISFIGTVDWFKLGEQIVTSISEIIQKIDWNEIIESAIKLLGEVVGGASALLAGVLKKAWEALKKAWSTVKDYFNKKIEECGGNVIDGIFTGILDALKSVGRWIKEHIFKPFIEGFKNAFDIHSPSKEMSKMGGYIIDGLFKGISDGIKKVREIAEKVLNAIKKVFQNVGNWFKEKFSTAWDEVKNVWDNVKGYFSDIWSGVKETFAFVGDWFGKKFHNAWNEIKKAFSNVWEFFNDKWENIKSAFGDVGEWFYDKFSKAYENIKSVFSDIGSFFSGIWENVSDGSRDGVNWILEKIENGLNNIIDGLNWFGFDLPEVMGGGHVGFDIGYVNLPRLAKGGLATAPTLAMVGDNANASVDPEVIAPLSKLKGIIGNETDNSEIILLLKEILNVLQNTTTVAQTEKSVYLYPDSKAFSRLIIKVIRSYKERGGTL